MTDAISRGVNAKNLTENPVFREAFEATRLDIIKRMEEVAIGDTATQHELVLSLQLLMLLKSRIHKFVRDGVFEEAKIAQAEQIRKRRGKMING